MADKRGASSSQKQQVQVYPKIDFCPYFILAIKRRRKRRVL